MKFKIKAVGSMMLSVMLIFTPFSRVHASDVNVGGETSGPGHAIVSDIVIDSSPTQGVRVTVVDLKQGGAVVGSPINFLRSSPKAGEVCFKSASTWKKNANGGYEETMFQYSPDPGIPKDIDSKKEWARLPSVLNKIAQELGMKVANPIPEKITPDILNQDRYKVILEPITTVKFKYLGVSIVGTINEHMKFFNDMPTNDKNAYVQGVGTYMLKNVPKSAFTEKPEEELNIAQGNVSALSASSRGGDVILYSGGQIGGTGIGIIGFKGAADTSGDQALPNPPQSGSYRIKKDFLNGTWKDQISMSEALDGSPVVNHSKSGKRLDFIGQCHMTLG